MDQRGTHRKQESRWGTKMSPNRKAGSDLGPIINSQEQMSWLLQNSEATDLQI